MADGRSYTTFFKADTSGLKKGTDEMINKLNELNKKLVDNQYKQKDSNKVISEAKKELKNIQKEIEKKGTADENQTKRIKELTNTIEDEKVKLSQLKTEQVSLRQAISQTSTDVANNNKQWTVLKATISNLTSDGLKKLAQKLLEIGKNVIQTGEQFSGSMAEVAAISGATDEELALLDQTAREYGSTTKFTASECAQGLKYMALAGWDVEQSTSALGGILNLAAASGMDLAMASDAVTDYLSAFGMQAEDSAYMADLLTYAQNNANTSAQQLTEAYGNCAANMNAAGQDIETTTAMLEAMANQGLKGSEAGTALAAVMRDITQRMDNGKISIGETKVAVQDANGDFRDLTSILGDVEKATEGMGTAEKSAALMQTFTAKSIKGVNLVLNEGISNISGYEEALRNSTGTADRAAKTMGDNLGGDIKILNSTLDELKLKVYDDAEAPIRSLVQTVTKYGVPALETIIENMDKIAPVAIAAATGMGFYKASLAITSIIKGVAAAKAMLVERTVAETAAENINTAAVSANTASETSNTTTTSANTAATNANAVAKDAETVATDSATAAQGALNTVQAANPIGLLAGLIGILIGGLTSYSLIAGTAADSTDEYSKALSRAKETIDDANTSLEDAKDSYNDIISNADTQAAELNQLSSIYEELRGNANKTQEEFFELDTVASRIAEIMGINSENLKDQNGNYKNLTKSIQEYIKNLKSQAEVEAATSLYNSAVKERVNAEVELQRIKSEAGKYIAEFKDEIDEYEKLGGEKGNGRITDVTKKYEEFKDTISELNNVVNKAKETEKDYGNELETVYKNQGKNKNGCEDNIDVLGEYVDAYSKAKNTIEDFEFSQKSASDRLKELNQTYEENQREIEKTQSELKSLSEEYEKSRSKEAGESIDELNNHLEELQAEQSEIENNIKSTETEVKDLTSAVNEATDAAVNAYDTMISSADALNNAQEEINKNGSVSLNTLNSLVKKYPELIGLVNDYIEGRASEQDILSALQNAYKVDYENFNKALGAKLSNSAEYYKSAIQSCSELVNKYKELYGIDVSNYATAEEAKTAVKKKLYAKYQQWLNEQMYDITVQNGQQYLIVKQSDGTWDFATQQQLDSYNRDRQAYFDTFSENFGNDINDAVANYYSNSKSADSGLFLQNLQSISPSSISGNATNSGADTVKPTSPTSSTADENKKTIYTTSGSGISATGDTYVQSNLNWLSRAKNLGKMSTESEIKFLEELKKYSQINADERYEIEYQLYQAKEKLSEQQAQIEKELAEEAAERAKQEAEKIQEQLNLVKAAYDKLADDKISALEKQSDMIQKTYQAELDALEEVKRKHEEVNADKERQNELDKINARLKYDRLDKFERLELERKKQDLLNEQAEVDFNRKIESSKNRLQSNMNTAKSKSDAAIQALESNKTLMSDYISKLQGNQSYDQRVSNNTTNQNIQIVQNGLNGDQVVNKLLKALGV